MRYLMLVMLVWSAGSAAACQMCASTLTYDALRFVPFFGLAVLAWVPVAVASDLQRLKHYPDAPSLVRPLVIYLAVVAVTAVLFGIHGILLALFPFLLWKWVLRSSRREVISPGIWRATLWIIAAMGLSVPLSYATLPVTANEVTVRHRHNRAVTQMGSLEQQLRSNSAAALPAALPADDVTDPFDYRLVEIPSLIPVTLWPDFAIPRTAGAGELNYVSSGTTGLIWSRGPDTRFDLSLSGATGYLTGDQEEIARSLAPSQYDPTNGMISGGDIFRVVSVEDQMPVASGFQPL